MRDRAVIVEGEAVPVDPNTGEFLPFQEVSRRRGRKTDLDRMSKEFPVTLFTFDCLLRGEEDLTGRPYTDRRKALEAVLKPTEGIRHSTVRVTDDVKQAESFFDEALQVGCELDTGMAEYFAPCTGGSGADPAWRCRGSRFPDAVKTSRPSVAGLRAPPHHLSRLHG